MRDGVMLIKTILKSAALIVLFIGSGLSLAQVSTDFSAQPPLVGDPVEPNVMLVMPNDHELFKKAYNDYSDINNDGGLETSYDDSITYAGYFDSNFCYAYDLSDLRFEPSADITSSIASNGHRCDISGSNLWSGNFMNWASLNIKII
jgi:type IV pilus assembly protein PilY1